MKTKYLCHFSLLLTLVCSGCSGGSNQVQGTWISEQQGPLSLAHDTLAFAPLESSGHYRIRKSSGFQRIRDGDTMAAQYKTASYTGWLDLSLPTGRIESIGASLHLNASKDTLYLNQHPYHRKTP